LVREAKRFREGARKEERLVRAEARRRGESETRTDAGEAGISS
jgi:hypothetical protein